MQNLSSVRLVLKVVGDGIPAVVRSFRFALDRKIQDRYDGISGVETAQMPLDQALSLFNATKTTKLNQVDTVFDHLRKVNNPRKKGNKGASPFLFEKVLIARERIDKALTAKELLLDEEGTLSLATTEEPNKPPTTTTTSSSSSSSEEKQER
jgi:hypothetical protein